MTTGPARWGAACLLALLAACSQRPPHRASAAPPTSDSLLAQGERVYLQGAFDSARVLWSEALARSRARHDSLGEARALTWLGLTAWRQGDYPTARALGEAALALKRRLTRDADLFKSYNALGLLAWNEGRLAEATERFGQASAAARAAGDLRGIASASGNLALVQTELGAFEEARRGFDSMRVAARSIGDARIEGNALTNLGMLAVREGDPAGAVPWLDSARARYRAASYPTGEQNALGQLGTAYAALGQPRLAVAALDSALELSRRQGLRQDEASNLEALAELYRDAGDVHRALDLYARAEAINRDLGLSIELGADLRSVAEIQAELGALDAAHLEATRAVESHRAARSRLEELTDLLLLAEIEAHSGLPAEAGAHLAEARTLAQGMQVHRATVQVALTEARIADWAGRPQDVLVALRSARPWLIASGEALEQESLRLEARALARLGRLDSAAAVGRRAVAVLERIRSRFASSELRTSYVAEKEGAYADLAQFLRRLGRTEEAFEVSDAARGRALIEGFATVRAGPGGEGAADSPLRRADAVLRTIAALDEQLRLAERDAADAPDSSALGRVRFLSDRVAAARGEYEELAIRLQEAGPPALTLLGAGRSPASSMLGSLREDEALLEYQPIDDSLVIFIARRSTLHSVAVGLPHGGLLSRVRLARELIAERNDTTGRDRPVLRALDDLLIRPVRGAGLLAGARNLIIVPHGALAYLPFAALVDSVTGRYLVQDFGLLTLPSAGALAALRARSGPSAAWPPVDVFAPDPVRLPGTRAEARAVSRAVPSAVLRIGAAATESAARDALAAGAVVHLAAHGELNARNPMFSWLATAPVRTSDVADDGRLEVHEVLGLRVRSPLVFLSGCETGLGVSGSTGFTPGEDFVTLARAFLYAGARNVVATLWRVDDQGAAAFAQEYYRRLAGGDPAAALAATQRTLLESPRYRSPYYWAGYTLAGEGRLGVAAKILQASVR